ncbi:hypothetical protein [Rothia nasimurium]|uniref:hypothetical protein n=1 Tax=Rothia nasimurium TaxID=85336 RepID=UPI001F4710F7|nr:hypothetical protein [Rothia nasimurium]
MCLPPYPSHPTAKQQAQKHPPQPKRQQLRPPAPTTAAEAPSPAQPAQIIGGTNCGTSSTGLTTIVIAEASPAITCDEAHRAMQGFNEQYFATGSLGPFASGAYTCKSRNDADRHFEGRSVTCTRPGVRLEAMNFYPLGGSPVSSNDPMRGRTFPDTLGFYANGAGCLLYPEGRIWCLNEVKNADGSTPVLYLNQGESSPLLKNMSQFGVTDPPSYALPAGSVVTAYGVACLNDGTSLICNNGTTSVRMNSSSFGR